MSSYLSVFLTKMCMAIGGLAHSSKYGTFSVDEEVIYLFFQVRWYLSHREVGLYDNNKGRTLGGHSG